VVLVQAHTRLVVALGHESAGVVAPVPGDLDRTGAEAAVALDRADDAVALDDLDVEPVTLAQLEGDRRLPRLAVCAAERREHGRDARPVDGAQLCLQVLRERECGAGGRQECDHEHGRGDSGHSGSV
jgi:hypothetical protein